MIKALKKLGIEGMFCNVIKALYDQPIANIMLNGGQLKPFLIKSGLPAFPTPKFNIFLEFLAREIR
jgi:hypothetical protein